MKKKRIFLGVLGILITAALFGAFAQTGEDLFQKALRLERNEGKLTEAIGLYEKVVNESADKSLAAKAQLRIGLCYEKLGQKKVELAQQAFQKVIANYPDQIEAVKVATQKLSFLGQMETVAQSDRKEFKMSKVMDGWGKVSPDGRFIASTNTITGNISIFEISSGKKREIVLGGNTRAVNSQFAAFLAWSRDGKSLVYSWSKNMKQDLRVVDLAGGDPLILYKSDDIDYIVPVDWSPDGNSILIAGSGKVTSGGPAIFHIKERMLELIEIGSKEHDWKKEGSVGFSPDGKYLLFTIIQSSETGQRDIFLYSLFDKSAIPLIQSPADDEALGWAADGKYLVYTSDRTGTLDLWVSEVGAGKTIGDPILIKRNVGSIKPMGISRDGALFYSFRAGFVDVKVTEIDIEMGKSLSEPFSVAEQYVGANVWPTWSPDGKQLLYISDRGEGPHGESLPVLCIYTLDTEEVKELKPALKQIRLAIWAPDGKSLLAVGGESDNHGLHKVDATTGHTSLLYEYIDGTGIHTPVYTSDGRKLYFRTFKWNHLYSERNYKIRSYDLDTKNEEILFTTKPETAAYLYELALSPDESQISFFTQSFKPICTILYIMPSQGGEPREILRYELPDTIVRHSWTPDGQNLIFAVGNRKTRATKLYKVSLETGQSQYLGMEVGFLQSFSLHPSGKYLAISSGKVSLETWVMENFLPTDIK